MAIEIRNLHKQFGEFTALHDINLSVAEGSLIALLGPSGCGKTTLLRILAGLERPDGGRISFFGQDVTDLAVKDRGIGFVFQHYALFRHLTVFENVAFGLRVKPSRERPNEAFIRHRVKELLDLVQLGWVADRYPDQLSGGQRQRIALARALAVDPKVLLLDEPFGALDANVRKELRRWLRDLHKELHVTSVFVTHDQDEAMEVADQVVVMHGGRIEQVGSPESVYERPETAFVSRFIGDVNVLHGTVGNSVLVVDGVELPLPGGTVADGHAEICVRPHDIELSPSPEAGWQTGYVLHAQPVANRVKVELVVGHSRVRLEAEIQRENYERFAVTEGRRVGLRIRRASGYTLSAAELARLSADSAAL